MTTADYWIERLGLQRHPEGGWFREVYRATESIAAEALPARFRSPHPFCTAIYFLLGADEVSALHRLKSDEAWHFYAGAAITVHAIAPDGVLTHVTLGPSAGTAAAFQTVIPAGYWFGATVAGDSRDAFALVGCTVAPGFLFEDFELARRSELIAQFPQHRSLIERLTRD